MKRYLSAIACASLAYAALSTCFSASDPDLLPWVSAEQFGDCPQTVLTNGALTIRVMHPDARKGFYRGGRFEWSGIISEAFSPAHRFIGHSPASGEAPLSLGTTSEFKPPIELPPGKDGEPARQIRIGIGSYVADPQPGADGKPVYRLENPASWTMRVDGKTITYSQDYRHPSGYAYEFRKVLALDPEKPVVTISYFLKNIGTQTLKAAHYCHNWFCLDDAGVGPAYELQLPYPIEPLINANNGRNGARIDGGRLFFEPAPSYEGPYWLDLRAMDEVRNNSFTLRNVETGSAVRHHGDWAPSYVHVYATKKAFCPEAHLALSLPPGESQTWTSRYLFEDKTAP